jgi:hypothetical protein
MRFLVPPNAAPGVYRERVGFFKPGDILELPDRASKPGDVPSVQLVPLDTEAYDALVQAHGKERARPIPGDEKAAIAAAAAVVTIAKPQTIRQALAEVGLADAQAPGTAKKSGRASDSK